MIAAVCKLQEQFLACIPKCCCEDAAVIGYLAIAKDYSKSYGCTFKFKCGGAAGLRASAFTVFIAAVVSIVGEI